MPFARIAAEWTHDNQTVPDADAQKLRRRSGELASVRGITLDTAWHKIDPKQSVCISPSHNPPIDISP